MIDADAVTQLLTAGCARLRLDAEEMSIVASVRATAAGFFARGEEWKRAHGDADGLYGYRRYGMQFSDSPDLPDECESFAYWADRRELIPGHEDLAAFIAALGGYWRIAVRVTGDVLAALASHYGYTHDLKTALSSYVEINAYGLPPVRELLQTRHEDGHLLTLVTPNKPGLEIEVGGRMQPEPCDGSSTIIMPGSLLTAMTGGEIQPMYHQVRNHRLPGRLTVLYFVNTPFSGRVTPYVSNHTNTGVDMAELAAQKCILFGKPPPKALV
jgi:isopenicillin N synthase-like dioxygenase